MSEKYTRKQFLQFVVAVGGSVFLQSCKPVFHALQTDSDQTETNRRIQNLNTTFNLQLLRLVNDNDSLIPWFWKTYEIEVNPLLHDTDVLNCLENALRKYPPEVLGQLAPLGFIFCGSLKIEGKEQDGYLLKSNLPGDSADQPPVNITIAKAGAEKPIHRNIYSILTNYQCSWEELIMANDLMTGSYASYWDRADVGENVYNKLRQKVMNDYFTFSKGQMDERFFNEIQRHNLSTYYLEWPSP